MIAKFHDHDYYFLDTLYLVVVLSLISFLKIIPQFKDRVLPVVLPLTIAFLLVLFYAKGEKKMRGRYKEIPSWDFYSKDLELYRGSGDFLSQKGIPKDEKIMVLGLFGPNGPFIHLERKGYAVDYMQEERFKEVLRWGATYAVVPNYYIEEKIKDEYPFVLENLNPIADNGKITLLEVRTERVGEN